MINKIVTKEQLRQELAALRAEGRKIISTSGCFDIVHAGHVQYLEEAKKCGDILIVMLNTDNSVRRLKGAQRPLVPQEERAIVLAGLQSVDYVCMFDEDTPCELIGEIKPDVVVKGGDYEGKHIPEMDTVAVYGGKVQYVLLVEGLSTTNIVQKIETQCKGK